MKIGIISINMYSKGLNFACPLHTYAFQQFLLKNQIESTILDYKPVYYDNFNLRHPSDYYAERYQTLSARIPQNEEEQQYLKEKTDYFASQKEAWLPLYSEREVRYDKFQHFIEQHYIKTDLCYDSGLLEVLDPDFDCYICATDVIWKNQPDVGYDRGFFLGSRCMENKWKLAYSASRGVYFANNAEEDLLFFHYLEDFDFISVREKSLQEYIRKNTGRACPIVLDPVLLHESSFYDSILTKPQEEHYLLLYYVMEKAAVTIEQAVNYARLHHLKIIEITDVPVKHGRLQKYTDVEHIFRFDIGIEEWLGYLKYADCVFTNSFHACCFSLLFERNLFVGFRQGDKVKNIMETFNLTNRIVTANSCFTDDSIPDIPYDTVRQLLKQKRAESSELLLRAIRSCENSRRPKKDYDSYKQTLQYPIYYNCKYKNLPFTWNYDESAGTVRHFTSGTYEYQSSEILYRNNGSSHFLKNAFHLKNHEFTGWHIRLLIDNHWFWYTENGTLVLREDYNTSRDGALCTFSDEALIPYIPVNRIKLVVAEAVWKKALHARILDKLTKITRKLFTA